MEEQAGCYFEQDAWEVLAGVREPAWQAAGMEEQTGCSMASVALVLSMDREAS